MSKNAAKALVKLLSKKELTKRDKAALINDYRKFQKYVE